MSLCTYESACLLTKYQGVEDTSTFILRDTIKDYSCTIMSLKWPMLDTSTREELFQRIPVMQGASHMLGPSGPSWRAKETQEPRPNHGEQKQICKTQRWQGLGVREQERGERGGPMMFRIKTTWPKVARVRGGWLPGKDHCAVVMKRRETETENEHRAWR